MSSSNRKPYLNASTISQALLDAAGDNLSNQIELIVDITAPDGSIIRASDRNKYVGEHFYEALTNFPDVTRTIGDFLGQGLVFSEMTFELSNADGRFNKYLPGGASFGGWIGRSVIVKIGLRDVDSSYVPIFRGSITEEGGFARSVKSITIKARDTLEKINVSFPPDIFSQSAYPKAVDDLWGKTIPLIYGDWNEHITPGLASIPAYAVNGADIFVNGEQLTVTVTLSPNLSTPVVFGALNHRLDVGDHIDIHSDNPSFPNTLKGNHYVVSISTNEFTIGPSGGPAIVLTTGDVSGNHYVTKHSNEMFENIKFVISSNTNIAFDTNQVWLKRSEIYYKVPTSSVVNVHANKNYFELIQDVIGFEIDSKKWTYQTSDEIFVRVHGKTLGSYTDNIVSIAQDILQTYGGVLAGDLDTSWTTFKNKITPAVSAIANIKGRAWIGEPQNVMEYVVSLLEQVRLELFFNRQQKLDLSALHWEEFVADSSFVIQNWDVEKDSLVPQLDDRNNFNRMRAVYAFLPDTGENAFSTNYYLNQAAINQAGKAITKVLIYPNLYIESDVINQSTETLKIVSSYREIIALNLTNRAILNDIGDFVRLNINIGSIQLSGVPCQIREISYSPDGLKLPVKLWSFAMMPFGSWNPSFVGIVGGESASISEE